MTVYSDRNGNLVSFPPRNAYSQARRTNDPLTPPASLLGKERRAVARRFRDLVRHFGQRLGPKFLSDEGVRAKVGILINLILKLEQARDSRKPLGLASEVLAGQEIRAILVDLGLDEAQPLEPDVKSGSGFRLVTKTTRVVKPARASRPGKPARIIRPAKPAKPARRAATVEAAP